MKKNTTTDSRGSFRLLKWLLNGLDALPWETDLEEDGGPGSGNWGHRGRPGKRGGSGKGGGRQYRSGSRETGFTRNQEAINTRNAGGEQITGPAKVAPKHQRANVPMSFTEATRASLGKRMPNEQMQERYQTAKKRAEQVFGGSAWQSAYGSDRDAAIEMLMGVAEQEDSYKAHRSFLAAHRALNKSMESNGVLSSVPPAWRERLTDQETQLLDTMEQTDARYFDEEDAKLYDALVAKLYGADIEVEIPRETVRRILGEEAAGETAMPGQVSMFAGENVPSERGEAWSWSTSTKAQAYEARREIQNLRSEMAELKPVLSRAEEDLKKKQGWAEQQYRHAEQERKRADEAERNGDKRKAAEIRRIIERDLDNSTRYDGGDIYEARQAEARVAEIRRVQAAKQERYETAKKRFLGLMERTGGKAYADRVDQAMERMFQLRERYEEASLTNVTTEEKAKMEREAREATAAFYRLLDPSAVPADEPSGSQRPTAGPEPAGRESGSASGASGQGGAEHDPNDRVLVASYPTPVYLTGEAAARYREQELEHFSKERAAMAAMKEASAAHSAAMKKTGNALRALQMAKERNAPADEIARLEHRAGLASESQDRLYKRYQEAEMQHKAAYAEKEAFRRKAEEQARAASAASGPYEPDDPDELPF